LSSKLFKDERQPGPLSKLSVRHYLCIIFKPDSSFELEIDRKFPSAWITTNIYKKSTLHTQRACLDIYPSLRTSVILIDYVLTHPQDCLSSAVIDLVRQDGCPSCEDKLHPVTLLKSVTKNFVSRNM
jgi:hypothetical protein